MSERKVLNKYIPPDFDPSKIPRRKVNKAAQQTVRLMAPFSMRCNSCGEYVYKGKKFNARKELVEGEDYYGIKIFRFYIKCPRCSSEITFRTDPRNTDYAAEHGASRNFEPWREKKEVDDENSAEEEDPLDRLLAQEAAEQGEQQDELDPMAALEQRTKESRREMDIADALTDLRTRNARNAKVDLDDVAALAAEKRVAEQSEAERKAVEEDDAAVAKFFGRAQDLAVKHSSPVATQTTGYQRFTPASGTSASSTLTSPPVLPSASTASEAGTQPDTTGKSVKRVRDDEPDVTSLLSDKAKAQLTSTAGKLPVPAKRRKRENPFGLAVKR